MAYNYFDFTIAKTGEQFRVKIEVDLMQAAKHLQRRARESVNKKSTALGGAVVCTVVKREG